MDTAKIFNSLKCQPKLSGRNIHLSLQVWVLLIFPELRTAGVHERQSQGHEGEPAGGGD